MFITHHAPRYESTEEETFVRLIEVDRPKVCLIDNNSGSVRRRFHVCMIGESIEQPEDADAYEEFISGSLDSLLQLIFYSYNIHVR